MGAPAAAVRGRRQRLQSRSSNETCACRLQVLSADSRQAAADARARRRQRVVQAAGGDRAVHAVERCRRRRPRHRRKDQPPVPGPAPAPASSAASARRHAPASLAEPACESREPASPSTTTSQAGTLTIAVQRRSVGLLARGRCRAGRRRSAKACPIWKTVRTVRRVVGAGAAKVTVPRRPQEQASPAAVPMRAAARACRRRQRERDKTVTFGRRGRTPRVGSNRPGARCAARAAGAGRGARRLLAWRAPAANRSMLARRRRDVPFVCRRGPNSERL